MAAIQGAFRLVFRTSGFAKAYVSTISNNPFALTSGAASAFFATTATFPVVYTAPNSVAFFATTNNQPVIKTAGQAVTFVATPDPNAPKELVLKIGTLDFDSSGLFVDVPDATGEYNASTNPGGYTPEADSTNPYRPKRSQVKLWTVYKVWDVYGDATQTPDSQTEENDVDYVYPLYFPTEEVAGETLPIKGIYQIILIAAPVGENYEDWIGNENLYDVANQYPDWYVTSVGTMVDQEVLNCLNKKRYAFLQEVMCGRCDEGYLAFYSDYIGMLNAMEIQDWPSAIDFYNKLKTQCSETNSSCGC
jgi:hypothetical protein